MRVPKEGIRGSEPLDSHTNPPVTLSCSWWNRGASSALCPLLLLGSAQRGELILDKSRCQQEDVMCNFCKIPIRERCMQQSYLLHTLYFFPAAGKRISCRPLNHQHFLPGCFKHSFIIPYTNFWGHCYFFVREYQSLKFHNFFFFFSVIH